MRGNFSCVLEIPTDLQLLSEQPPVLTLLLNTWPEGGSTLICMIQAALSFFCSQELGIVLLDTCSGLGAYLWTQGPSS